MPSPLFSHLEFLPIAYGLVLLCVASVGVLARFLAQKLLQVLPTWLARLLSMPLGMRWSGDDFLERLFDPYLLLNLRRELAPGLVLPLRQATKVHPLCPQRDGTIEPREQLLAGKYWSGTQPEIAA
jgi:hypothetical protein